MILTKYVKIKISSRNKNYYIKKGYEIKDINENIIVNINDLSKGSHINIDVKCDICGKIKKIKYKDYNKSISKYNLYTCSRKCSQIKIEKTNLKKYGVKYAIKSDIIKKKIKETNLKKYGVENVSQNKEIKEKIKETNLKKYDVEYILQSTHVKEKIKETNLKKYGVENVSQNKEIKEKIKQTNLKKYGVEYIFQLEDIKNKHNNFLLTNFGINSMFQLDIIKEKSKETNLKKYGVKYAIKSDIIKEKIKETNLKKYGVEHVLQNKFILKNANKEYLKKIKIKMINKIPSLINIIDGNYIMKCNKCNKIYKTTYNLYNSRKRNNITLCTLCNPINNKSEKETNLLKFIKDNYEGKIITNSRKIISPYELDIYLPDLNLAFEFNGIYWHSNKYKPHDYHHKKTKLCNNNNIKLFHVWEDEWINNTDIIKSQIITEMKNIKLKHKYNIKEINNKNIISNFYIENSNYKDIVIKNNYKNYAIYLNNNIISLITIYNNKIIYFTNKKSIIYNNIIDIFTKYIRKKLTIKYDISSFNPFFKYNILKEYKQIAIKTYNEYNIYNSGFNLYMIEPSL